jgi:hypothetical protein
MSNKEIEARLIQALTAYDRKQSTRRGYNPYALGQYFERVENIMRDIAGGATPRQAIIAGFTGRLQDAALRAIGEPIAGDAEQVGGPVYRPASA